MRGRDRNLKEENVRLKKKEKKQTNKQKKRQEKRKPTTKSEYFTRTENTEYNFLKNQSQKI